MEDEEIANLIIARLQVMGLTGEEQAFGNDPISGERGRRLATWRVQRGVDLSVSMYSGVYFETTRPLWVGFGSAQAEVVDKVLAGTATAFVRVGHDGLDDPDLQNPLREVSFTTLEDYRHIRRGNIRGWVWFGRYFERRDVRGASEFLCSFINMPRPHFPLRTPLDGPTEATGSRQIRLGQDDFREMMMTRWGRRCALTQCGIDSLLEAAHIVPWSKDDTLRLSPDNGLLLLATVHRLFDAGLISFSDDSRLIVKDIVRDELVRLRLDEHMSLKPALSKEQKRIMRLHREKHRFSQ